MKIQGILKKSTTSQKKIVWGVAGIAIAFLVYIFGIHPLVEAKKRVEEEIALKRRAIVKYEEYLQNRKAIEEELDRTLKQHEVIQQKLIPGETPQLGAANLQEIVKRLAAKNGITIRSFRIVDPKEINSYQKVSIYIDFNPTNSMLSLGQFLYDIEHHEKELMISEIDFLVFNIRMPNHLQGSLVISGFMKSAKMKEKGREG